MLVQLALNLRALMPASIMQRNPVKSKGRWWKMVLGLLAMSPKFVPIRLEAYSEDHGTASP